MRALHASQNASNITLMALRARSQLPVRRKNASQIDAKPASTSGLRISA